MSVLVATMLLLSPPAPEARPIDFLVAAETFAVAGDLDRAELVLREGSRQHAAAPGFHLALGAVLESRGFPEEAFYEYQWEMLATSSKELAEECARRINRLARLPEVEQVLIASTIAQTKPSETRRRLAQIRSTRGNRVALLLYEATAARMAGDTRTAEELLAQVLVEAPALVPAWLERADAARLEGRTDDAHEYLSRAHALDPMHPLVRARR